MALSVERVTWNAKKKSPWKAIVLSGKPCWLLVLSTASGCTRQHCGASGDCNRENPSLENLGKKALPAKEHAKPACLRNTNFTSKRRDSLLACPPGRHQSHQNGVEHKPCISEAVPLDLECAEADRQLKDKVDTEGVLHNDEHGIGV